MNKIPITIATISQYISPERIRLGIPLLNCPKESAPMTNSRNKLPIPFPNTLKKVIQEKYGSHMQILDWALHMKIGRNGMACCPFHDDKHVAFSSSP